MNRHGVWQVLWLALAIVSFLATSVRAQEMTPEEKAKFEQIMAAMRAAEAKMDFKSGTVTMDGNIATLNLPPEYRFLGPDDSDTVLVKFWGNPPDDDKPLGMIVPAGMSVLDNESWAVVITYEEDGHVKDSDADSIDYGKLLKEMQEGTREANKERKKEGYETVDLVGWAAPPHYDKAAHKIYWAKELAFSESEDHTLNYCVRVLGRKGVLELNMVAAMNQFAELEKKMPGVVKAAEFTQGNRYEDFKEGSDKVAAYGLTALVAGGVAAKAGLFKGLFAALLAAKKLIVVGLVALGGLLSKIFGRKKSNQT